MVNQYGEWTPEKDYNSYPKKKWCDMDYIANYIQQKKYTPQTSIKNLSEMIILYLEDELERKNDKVSMYKEDHMINIEAVDLFVETSGGLREFDYRA